MKLEKQIAQYLLQIKAIKLSPANPFSWASGWNSPIYCDNRKTLSYPEIRSFIADNFSEGIKNKYPDVEVIAGVATGGIPHGALVAERLGLPFIYVRSTSKKHGLENKIEGQYQVGQKTVVIEDLISTGGSSLSAVDALRSANLEVLGMMAIFTYGFPVADKNFEEKNVELSTLGNYSSMLETALESEYITADTIETLQEWRKSPETWNK